MIKSRQDHNSQWPTRYCSPHPDQETNFWIYNIPQLVAPIIYSAATYLQLTPKEGADSIDDDLTYTSGSTLVSGNNYFTTPLVTVMLIGLFVEDIWGASWISWIGTWSRIGGWFEWITAFTIDLFYQFINQFYELVEEDSYADVAIWAKTGFYIKLATWVAMRVVVWTAYDDQVIYVEYQNWLGEATEEQLALQEALLNPKAIVIKGDSSESTEQDVEEEFDATF